MKKKWTLFLATLMAFGMLGMATSCAIFGGETSTPPESSSPSVPETYTVTFVADGTTVQTVTYEEGAESITEPTVPAKDHYTGAWATYELDGNVTVNAVYTAIEYTVTFVADGVTVDTQAYTVENKTITEPTVPAKDHYTGTWATYELDGNVTVNAVYTAIEYTVTFVADGVTVGTQKYTVENTEITEPEIPGKPGYRGEWEAYTLEGGDKTVNATYEAGSYTITYNANGGTVANATQSVEYGVAYVLETPTAPKAYQVFLGWKDEDGNVVASGEEWNIAKDVTLTASYSEGLDFEELTAVPAFLSGSQATLSIVEMNGNKVLEAKTTEGSTTDVGLHITTEVLGDLFEDSDVEYVAFDLMSGADKTGKQVYYYNGSSWTNYENGGYDSIPTDSFKTYWFPRAVYEAWVSAGVDYHRMVMIGNGLVCGGESFYVDNIRSATAEDYTKALYSFEAGGLRTNAGMPMFYVPNGGQWELGFQNIDLTTVKFTSETVSDGNRALTFTTLGEGKTGIIFNHTTDTEIELAMRAAGYVAFDLYVAEGSDAMYENVSLATGWNTLYAKVDATNNTLTYFSYTKAGTYVIDNFRLLTEAEYMEETAYSFEKGASALSSGSENNDVYYTVGGYTFTVDDRGTTNGVQTSAKITAEQAYSGKYSLAFDKALTDNQIDLYVSANSGLVDGFTFWIYSTAAIPGGLRIVDGSAQMFLEGGIAIEANTWTKITVSAEHIKANGRFMILQGTDYECTIYIDGFQPLSAE